MSDANAVAAEANKKVAPTPEFRASFPFVFQPRLNKQNPTAEAKYSITMLFRIKADPAKPDEKVVDIRPLVLAATNAAIEKWGPKEKWPKGLDFPFRKGEEKSHIDGYGEGVIAVSATSKQQPSVWNEYKKDIIDPKEFYPGCFAVASVVAFAWENTGKKGVSFGLRNIMKTRNGKMLGGGAKPEEDFSSIPAQSAGAVAEAAGAAGGIEDLGIPGM
jgi:hypothetical protein